MARLLIEDLAGAGYRALRAGGVESARSLLIHHAPGLVVLDIKLGDDFDAGYRLAAEIRSGGRLGDLRPFRAVKIVMLTERDSDAEIESGFTTGADLYFPKFTYRRSLFLGHLARLLPPPRGEGAFLEYGAFRVHQADREAWLAGARLQLRPQVFLLLAALIRAAGEAVPDQQLRHAVGIHDQHGNIRVLISQLRASFRAVAPQYQDLVVRTRGLFSHEDGYRLQQPPAV